MAAELREEDLRVDVHESGVAGVNYTCTVRIVHLPTGIEANASVPPMRSQMEAKAQCLAELRETLG